MGLGLFRWSPKRMMNSLDNILRWFVLDGYGFIYGLLRPKAVTVGRRRPREFKGVTARAFDVGIGRTFWFYECAEPTRVVDRINTFDEERRGDLWTGLGTACTHACGVSSPEIESLIEGAGPYAADLACGAALTAYIRREAGNIEDHVEMGVNALWGVRTVDVAETFSQSMALARKAASPEEAYLCFRGSLREAYRSNARMTFRQKRGAM
jgi:hypothetical protein